MNDYYFLSFFLYLFKKMLCSLLHEVSSASFVFFESKIRAPDIALEIGMFSRSRHKFYAICHMKLKTTNHHSQ